MRFRYHPIPSLPPLAWCARLARGADAARVYHGAADPRRSRRYVPLASISRGYDSTAAAVLAAAAA